MVRSAVNQKSQELGLALENVVDREGWNITTARVGNTLHTQEVSLETCAVVNIFTQSEFERFSGQQVDLAENQVLLFDPANTFPEEDTLHIDDKTYEIVPSDYVMPEASTLAQIYEMYYLVVRDETVVENILAPSGSDTFPIYSYDFDVAGGDPEDIAALREALGTVDFSGPGVEYAALLFEDSATSRQSFMELYGGLFFLGLFLGVLFLLGTALIIYYKQVSEGYDDARRFNIMQKVGMSHKEVKQSIHSQILLVFFLPLVMAVLHLAFAFPHAAKDFAGNGPEQLPADPLLHSGLRGGVRCGVPRHLRPDRPHLLQHCGERQLTVYERRNLSCFLHCGIFFQAW